MLDDTPLSASKAIVDFLQDEARDYLRAVAHSDDEQYEMLYMRGDVTERYSHSDLEPGFEYWRSRKAADDGPLDLEMNH